MDIKNLDKKNLLLGILGCLGISYLGINYLAWPMLFALPALAEKLTRFSYSKQLFFWVLFSIMFFFYLQWVNKKLYYLYIYIVYTIYFPLMFITLFAKIDNYHGINLNPFNFFLSFDPSNLWKMGNPILNFIAFIPLGVLYAFRLNFRQFLIIALGTTFGIETIQYLFHIGVFETSDILLNFFGCLVGYKFWQKYNVRFQMI